MASSSAPTLEETFELLEAGDEALGPGTPVDSDPSSFGQAPAIGETPGMGEMPSITNTELTQHTPIDDIAPPIDPLPHEETTVDSDSLGGGGMEPPGSSDGDVERGI